MHHRKSLHFLNVPGLFNALKSICALINIQILCSESILSSFFDWCISRRRKKYTDLWPDCFKSIAHRIYITIKVIKNSILMFKYLYLLLIWTSEKSISSSSSKSHWLAFLMVATAVTMDAAIVTIPAKIQIIQGNPKLCKSGFRLVANSLWSATKTMDPPRINRPINKINIMNMINNIINNYCIRLMVCKTAPSFSQLCKNARVRYTCILLCEIVSCCNAFMTV